MNLPQSLAFVAIAIVAHARTAHADAALDHSTLDFAGGRQTSPAYSHDGSLNGFGSALLDAPLETEVRTGFAGQLNEAPSPGGDTLSRLPGRSAKVLVADLLGNDRDLEGDALTFQPTTPSINGASIAVDGPWLLYQSTARDPAIDTIRYKLTDSFGSAAFGEIMVVNQSLSDAPLLTLLRIDTLNGGDIKRIVFVGIAGRAYAIQAATDLTNPVWQTLGSATAGANGMYSFDDLEAGSDPVRFYRSIQL